MKKTIIFSMIILGAVSNAFALPTVRKLGTTPVGGTETKISSSAETIVRSNIKGNAKPATVKQANAVSEAEDVVSTNRMPLILHKINKIDTQSAVKPTVPDTPSVSSAELDRLNARVDSLENTIADLQLDVIVTEDGYYVTDVDKEDTTITVTKSNKVELPVKNLSGSDTNDKAEIWIVK
nr:hypothetical protein [Candidatus Enterousia merdequi]